MFIYNCNPFNITCEAQWKIKRQVLVTTKLKLRDSYDRLRSLVVGLAHDVVE